jgi:hypothetical protein
MSLKSASMTWAPLALSLSVFSLALRTTTRTSNCFLSKKALAIFSPRKPVAPAIKTVLNSADMFFFFGCVEK